MFKVKPWKNVQTKSSVIGDVMLHARSRYTISSSAPHKLCNILGAILFEKPELMSTFLEARQSIDKYLRKDDWFVWATMLRGHVTLPVFQSLESYYPGLLSLIGNYINKQLQGYIKVIKPL